MIIGAAKAGTTSLHHYLSQHPQIYLPKEKELQFFTDDTLYQRGTDYYIASYFKNARKYPARGESTPFYFHRPETVIPRLEETFDGVKLKFILILRHPVFRAWSHYQHMVRLGLETHDFKQALFLEDSRLYENPLSWFSYYSDGLYCKLLMQWFDAFPRERFLILTQDELAAEPHQTLRRIFLFLDVDPSIEIADLSVKNEARIPSSRVLMKLLMGRFPGASLLKKAMSVPVRRRWGMRLRQAATIPDTKKQMVPDEIFEELTARYASDLGALEQLLGRSFQSWRSKRSS